MKKITYLLLFTISFWTSCIGQTKPNKNTIYNKDFKWTITIPSGFDTVNVQFWDKMQNKGAEAIEKTYDVAVKNNTKTIFVFRSDQINYFVSNFQPFDKAKDGNYFENFRGVNKMLYGTFEAQFIDAKLDSSYSSQIINGLVFQTFKLDITLPNKKLLRMLTYSRLFGKKDFTVSILTLDRSKEKELLECWLNSKFDR